MISFQNVDFKAKIQALFLVTTLCGRYLLREADWTSSSEAPTRLAVHILNLFKVKENFINTKGNNRRDLLLQVAVSHTQPQRHTYTYIQATSTTQNSPFTNNNNNNNLQGYIGFNLKLYNISFKYATESGADETEPFHTPHPSTSLWPHQLHRLMSKRCTFGMRQFYCQLISVSLSTRDQYYFMPHLNRVVWLRFFWPNRGQSWLAGDDERLLTGLSLQRPPSGQNLTGSQFMVESIEDLQNVGLPCARAEHV